MSMSIKKRLYLGAGALATVGAVGTLVAGTTFGLFSAQQVSGNHTFTAGTVTLGSPVVGTCTVSNIVPGDSDSSACTIAVTTGASDVNADVAIDVSVTGGSASAVQGYGCPAPSIASGLYDSSANGLQITLTDANSTSYDLSGLNAASSSTTNLLTARNVAPGTTETYTLGWSLPDKGCASNNYQGASTTFQFTVHSVQAAHQPTDTTTAGHTDSTLSWS
jgi:predicted ribosomally synthesized peptide with SipW-like signal peptide